jgi:hypothetical protein
VAKPHLITITLIAASRLGAQSSATTDAPPPEEKWNLYYQATSIGDYHGKFRSPYSGPFSLRNETERDVSLTTTLFLGFRLDRDTQVYFNPEIAGGRGFSGVNGVANAPNGELPRVASATPKPYLARLYVTHDFGIGSEREAQESDENSLGGSRPATRYSITVGRFTVTDFFDNNKYSHDPRTQFLGWGVMYNGAFDYPADVRGYTWGWVHEFHAKRWALRYGSAAEPRVANGLRFDRRLFRDRGDLFEGELHYAPGGHEGTVRVLGFLLHTRSGDYAEAVRVAAANHTRPDITSVRQVGTLKSGVGVSAEQALTDSIGVFGRLGWNDGHSESFAFTAIDRLVTGGVSVAGKRWKRPQDVVASEITRSGISSIHRQYLAAGGYDFLVGDGALNYSPEMIWESYYSAKLGAGLTASIDAQHVSNPAYNRDRGPVWIASLRLHMEFGVVKKK